MGRDRSVGKATRYGLDGSGWNPGGGNISVGPTRPPVQWVLGLFPGRKRPGRGADRPIPSSAEVKERVEL